MAAANRMPHYDPTMRKITVRGAETFPEAIFDLADPQEVEILDMSFGQLSSLPSLERFKNLQVAFFSYNPFTRVPEVLARCPNLNLIGMRGCNIDTFPEHALPENIRAIVLTDNRITKVPQTIGDHAHLQKLLMTGNRLRSIPEALRACQNLEIIRLSVNDIPEPPEWLFDMPRLAWYADSSNPFSPAISQQPPEIDWSTLAIGKKLGSSANNVVHQAQLQDGKEVAVKLFGGSMVTDGMAADDMNACLLAGEHANVVGAIGKLVNAPDGQKGLVMPLVPADFTNLGKPPSFTTICRDTYPDGQTFLLPYVVTVLKSVAMAMTYLHSRGIMHGDLYAHNILTNAIGESRVGDFGGASLYEPGSASGRRRERIDVCAFGHLLEELLSRCDTPAQDATMAKLQELQKRCTDERAAQRPLFAEIVGDLA